MVSVLLREGSHVVDHLVLKLQRLLRIDLVRDRLVPQLQHDVREHVHGRYRVLAEPHRSTPTDRGGSRVVQVLHLKQNAHVSGKRQTVSCGQRQQSVVVQHGVQILRPLGIHIAVEHDPVTTRTLSAHVVVDLSNDVGEHTVRPLGGDVIERAEQLLLADRLRVDRVNAPLFAVQTLHRLQETAEDRRLAASRRTHQHHAVTDLLDLVQLKRLLDESVRRNQVVRDAHLLQHRQELRRLDLLDGGAREDAAQQRLQQRQILRHELWHDGVTDAADENVLLEVHLLGAHERGRLVLRARPLQVARTHDHAFQCAQTEVVVRLRGQLVVAQRKQKDDLARELL